MGIWMSGTGHGESVFPVPGGGNRILRDERSSRERIQSDAPELLGQGLDDVVGFGAVAVVGVEEGPFDGAVRVDDVGSGERE